jgi:hypothetical protein
MKELRQRKADDEMKAVTFKPTLVAQPSVSTAARVVIRDG